MWLAREVDDDVSFVRNYLTESLVKSPDLYTLGRPPGPVRGQIPLLAGGAPAAGAGTHPRRNSRPTRQR